MNDMIVNFKLSTKVWGEAIILVCHIYWHCFEYLEVWGYLANVMLPEPKMKKLSFKNL
jgi:hypothetical protein